MSITVPAPDPALAVGIDCPLRVLDLDGTRLPDELLDPHLTDIDESALTNLYVDMVRVRRLDTEAFALTRQGHLVLWPPLLGQEAAQVGTARALRHDDWVFASYREHAFALQKGADKRQYSTRQSRFFLYFPVQGINQHFAFFDGSPRHLEPGFRFALMLKNQ